MKKEWLYLTAIMDWYSRYIISWELSDSLNDWFCTEALKRALVVAIPKIHNSDQGSQFTGDSYLGILKQHPEISYVIFTDNAGNILYKSNLAHLYEIFRNNTQNIPPPRLVPFIQM